MATTEDMDSIPENVPDRFIVSSIIIKNKENNSALLNEAFEFMKLNYKCKKEDSPDGSNKCSSTENSSDLKSMQSRYKELSDKKVFDTWEELKATNDELKELNKKINKELKKNLGTVPPGFKKNKDGFFAMTESLYGAVRLNPTGEGWISKILLRSSSGKGPMFGATEEIHPDKESAVNYIRQELKLPESQIILKPKEPTKNDKIQPQEMTQEKYQQTTQIMDNLKSGKLSRTDVTAAITSIEQREKQIQDKYRNEKSVLSEEDDKKLYDLGNKKDVLQSALDFTRIGYTGPGPKLAKNNSALLNEVFEFIKLNYNCPRDEKNISEHPCSTANNHINEETEKVSGKSGNNILLIKSHGNGTKELIVDISNPKSKELKELLIDTLKKRRFYIK